MSITHLLSRKQLARVRNLPVVRRYQELTQRRQMDKIKEDMQQRLREALYAGRHTPRTDHLLRKLEVLQEEINRGQADVEQDDCAVLVVNYLDLLQRLQDQVVHQLNSMTHKKSIRWVPRSFRWTQREREEKRRANDATFRNRTDRARKQQETLQTLVLQIANIIDKRVMRLKRHGPGAVIYWDCPGLSVNSENIVLTSDTPGLTMTIPLPPKSLLRRVVLNRRTPVGLMLCRTEESDVFACYDVSVENKWRRVGWSIDGVAVSTAVVHRSYAAEDILQETQQVIRQIMIRRFPGGPEALLDKSVLREAHRDDCGVLYRDVGSDMSIGSMALVHVLKVAPTDRVLPGSLMQPKVRLYRVPGNMQTATEAVAWMFSVNPEAMQAYHSMRLGDLLLTFSESRPEGLIHLHPKLSPQGRFILATDPAGDGFFFVETANTQLWEGFVRYLEVRQLTQLKHPNYTSVTLLPGFYQIHVRREFDPAAVAA